MKKILFFFLVFCSFAAFSQSANVTLNLSATDNDGTVSTALRLASGTASAVNIATPSSPTGLFSSVVTFTEAGVYIFEFTATDNDGAIARQQFKVTVLKAPNQPPVIKFIEDITTQMPPKA